MYRPSPFLLAPLFLLMVSPCAFPDVWVVKPDGSGDVPTLQEAIDTAASYDVIELGDGTFTGEGNRDLNTWGKSLVFRSASNDPAECIIDLEGTASTLHYGLVWADDG